MLIHKVLYFNLFKSYFMVIFMGVLWEIIFYFLFICINDSSLLCK